MKKMFKKRVSNTRHIKKTIATPAHNPVVDIHKVIRISPLFPTDEQIQKQMDLAEQAQIKERRQKFVDMVNNTKLLFDSFMDDVICEMEEFEYNGKPYQQIKAGRRRA